MNINDKHTILMNSRYHDGLIAFKKRCTDYSTITSAIDLTLCSGEIGASLRMRPEIRVADIGCGDGTVTSHLASVLKGMLKGNTYMDVVEPVEHYLEQIRDKIEPILRSGFRVAYIKKKAEEYFSSPLTVNCYDLIFSSHSLHLVPLDVLPNIVSSLKPDGFLIVIIGARTSIMSALKDLFIPIPAITGEDILRFMQTNFPNIHTTAVSQPSVLDLNGIELPERKEDLTEEVKNILSLMIQKNIDDVDEAGYAKVKQLIFERLCDGKIQLDNDFLIFKKS